MEMETSPEAEPADQANGDRACSSRAPGGADRRPLRFWQPFNDWWRGEMERTKKRPTANDILKWYNEHAATVWPQNPPSVAETRVHAKCLRSLPLVREYFRNYRAKKRTGGNGGGLVAAKEEEGEQEAGPSAAAPLDISALLSQAGLPATAGNATVVGGGLESLNWGGQAGLSALLNGAGSGWPSPTGAGNPQQSVLLLQHSMNLHQQLALAALASQFAANGGQAGGDALPTHAGLPGLPTLTASGTAQEAGDAAAAAGSGAAGSAVKLPNLDMTPASTPLPPPKPLDMSGGSGLGAAAAATRAAAAAAAAARRGQRGDQEVTESADSGERADAAVATPLASPGGTMALSREALVQLNREQLIDQLMETRVLLDQKASLAKRKEQEVVLLRGRLRKAEERVKATEARNGELQRVLAAVREAGLLAEEGENGAVGGQQEEGVAAGPHQPPGASALHPDSTPSASRMGALGVHMNGPNSATPGAPIVTPAALGVDDGVAAGQALEALLASPQVEAYRMPGSASGLGMPRS